MLKHTLRRLAVYGGTCAAGSVVFGALTRRDRFAIACCLLLFGLTAYVGVIMSRVVHN